MLPNNPQACINPWYSMLFGRWAPVYTHEYKYAVTFLQPVAAIPDDIHNHHSCKIQLGSTKTENTTHTHTAIHVR